MNIDVWLFQYINQLPHSLILDSIAQMLSGYALLSIVWIGIAGYILWREEHRDHWFFVPIFAGIGISWSVSELFLKPIFTRVRPFQTLSDVIAVAPMPHGYSFPSSHATMAFAAAYIIAHRDARLRAPMYILAFFVALSRIYLGHHYPSDVLCGAAVGMILGWCTICAYRRFRPLQKRQKAV